MLDERGRQSWIWEFTADELLEACRRKRQFHAERVEFWTAQVEIAETALRQQGLELREQPVTGGYNLTAILDPQRQKAYQEAKSKLEYHHHEAETMGRYIRLFERSGDNHRRFELTYHDIAYFEVLDDWLED